ncbi:P-loop NTPase fold protein [Trichormus variabilis]|uniref:P-loop NTPase fold protein n=1 Tax=Anabaena variabilis TaxID=264691 RepID=UPI00283A968D|nr:P-loop NTPase fold protein [Trichormus variabilis]
MQQAKSGAIAWSLKTEVLTQSLKFVQNIKVDYLQAEALTVITSQITEINPQLLQELLSITQNINYYAGVEAIAFITSNLKEIDSEIIEQFLTIAQNINNEFYQIKGLATIAPHVNEPRRREILKKALDLVRKTRGSTDFISVENITSLINLAALLDKDERTEVFQQALEALPEKIENGVNIFSIIAPQLTEFEPQLLEKTLEIVNNLERGDYQREALVAIAPYLPKSEPILLQQALEIAYKIANEEYDRIKALAAIAPHLKETQCNEVLYLILERIENIWPNFISGVSETLVFIASYLSKSQSKLLQKAFNIVQNLEFGSYDQAIALVALAPHLSKLEPQLLQQALKIAINIKEGASKVVALFAVIPHLPQSKSQLLEKAFEIIQTIEYDNARSRALVAVIPHLSDFESHLLDKSLEIIEKLVSTYDSAKAQALVAVAPQLRKFNPSLLQKALEIAKKINSDEQKDEALAAIAYQLSESEPELLEQYLKIAQNTYYHSHHKHRIAIIPYLREPQQTEFLQKYFSATASSLASAAPCLPEPKRSEVLQEALKMLLDANYSDLLRANELKIIVPLLSKTEQKEKVIEIAKTIKNDTFKGAEILAFVATHLSEFDQVKIFFLEIIERLKAIENDSSKAKALAVVIPYLSKSSPESLDKAFEIAENLQYQSCQFDDLVTLATHLKERECIKLLEQALEKAKDIDSEYQQAQDFASILSQLPKSGSGLPLLYKILEIVKATENELQQANTIAAIAPYLPSEAQVIQQFLDIIFQIKQKQNLIKALNQSAFRFPEEVASRISSYQFSAALEIIKQSRNDSDKTKFISALAPRLSSGLIPTALRVITENIFHPAYRAEAFSNLAPYLPRELRRETLSLIEKSIPGQYHRTQALCNLIPHLYISQIPQTVDIVENKIQDLTLKACILNNVTINLRKGHKNNLYETAEIHSIISKIFSLVKNIITNEQDKTKILTELVTLLPDHDRNGIFEIIYNLKEEDYKAQILSALSLLHNLSKEDSTKIINLADSFKSQSAKCKVLTNFWTQELSDEEFDSISSNIVDIAYVSPILSEKTEILTDLALYSPQKQHKALRAIRELNISYLQYKYLERLVPYLQPDNFLEAQSIAQEIQEEYYRVKSLIALACKFPQVRTEAKRQAQDFKNQTEDFVPQKNYVQGFELLCRLAIEVPEILPEILKDLEKIKPKKELLAEKNQSELENSLTQWQQRQILIVLKPHLPIRIIREIDREQTKGKIPNELWYRSLRILRKTYRDALIGGSFRNDTDLNEDLLNLKDEIDALANMLLMRDLEPPVAVGILGGWGGGKSYILHLMQNRILEVRSEGITEQEAWSENPSSDELYPYVGHIYQIKFDAWTYAKSDLWASLMQTIFFELDRQISLEQQLIKVGIEPCAENSAKIWQVLYQVSEEDRNWFLERVLTVEQLQNFQDSKQKQDFPDNLWQIFTKSQRDSIRSYKETKEELINKEKELQVRKENLLVNLSERDKDLQERLANAEQRLQIRLDEIVADIREKQSSEVKLEPSDNEKKIHLILGYSAVVLERTLGDQGFNKIFDEKIQAEVNKKINLKINIKSDDITKVSSWLKGVVTVAISNNYQSITLYSVREWAKKNKLLIIIFFVCLLLAILLPAGIQFFNNLGSSKVIAQVVGFFTPMLPAIATLQALWTTGKKWYDETQLALNEYKTSYEQALEERVQKLVKKREEEIEESIQEGIEKAIQQDERLIEVNEELASLRNDKINDVETKIANEQKQAEENAKIRQLEGEVLELRNKLEKQQQELPENIYASLGEFISARINNGSYEKRLGIMHQVKQDLAALSYKLLPPPADSKDYAAKIDFLKKAFPRGPARVILYIDDLDRCSPDTVVQVLEAVQLLVKNRLFIAVVAIDERYINRALAKYYQGVLSSQGRPSPADYLEKIIQIPYRVTSIADSALRQYLKSQVAIQDSGISGNKFNEFSPEEFNILVQCCQEVDLSPRSLKRLTNVYKLFKVLNRIQGHKSSAKEQQAILALLAFSGRYPDLMRDLLKDIESRYEEYRNQPINDNLINFFRESLQKHENKYKHHSYLYEELNKLRHDIDKVIPDNLTLEDIKQIFDFVRRFSFVGDIGYDVDYQKGVNF